ncbi:MAG: hypothetical protein HYY01_11915 [Chloroflexi bacterium]|nr:hypothetical protein [Chloroflexota bacterium]
MPPEPEQQGQLILLGENLSPNVSQALRLVDYNARHGTEVFPQRMPDPTVVPWLALQQAVWVTADERARRQWAEEIRRAGIPVIWVHRPKEGLSRKALLLLLLWVLDPILTEVAKARGPRHFRASFSGKRPKWEALALN